MDLPDYVAKYLAQDQGGDFEPWLIRQRQQRVLQSLRAHPHRRVLEAGCGLQPMFVEFDDYDTCVVVEPSEEFVMRARARANDKVTCHVGFFETIAPTLPRDWDVVIVSSLLHEVADPTALLAAIHDVCDAHTVVHINVSNARSFHRLLAHEMGLLRDLFEMSETAKSFQRHSIFDLASLRDMVERAGFSVVDSGSYFIKPLTNRQMSRLLDDGIADPAIVEGLARMTKYMPDLGSEIFVDVRRSGEA